METVFRGLEVEVYEKDSPPSYYSDVHRSHVLIKDKETKEAFVDVVPMVGMPYWTPYGYEFEGWVLVPADKEIKRNYDLEETSIGSFFSRRMVAITPEEFAQLKV